VSPGMARMLVTFIAMGMMVLSLFLIYLGRYKIKNAFRWFFTITAYIFMILSGLIIFVIVFSGPTTY